MPESVVWVIDSLVPSGENDPPNDPSAGSVSFRSTPVATSFSVSPVVPFRTCGPLESGLMRDPPSRNIGEATSASVGMLLRCVSSSVFRSGDTTTPGSGSASMMSMMTLGGVR